MALGINFSSGGHGTKASNLHDGPKLTARVQPGKRQHAIFADLAVNPGASVVHVSENGNRSFSDRFDRNLTATPELLANGWALAAFSVDNDANPITAYLDGKAKRPASGPAKIPPIPPTIFADHPKPNYCPKRASTKPLSYSSIHSRKSA